MLGGSLHERLVGQPWLISFESRSTLAYTKTDAAGSFGTCSSMEELSLQKAAIGPRICPRYQAADYIKGRQVVGRDAFSPPFRSKPKKQPFIVSIEDIHSRNQSQRTLHSGILTSSLVSDHNAHNRIRMERSTTCRGGQR